MPLYNSVEYSDNESKTLGGLWQFYKDESFLDNDGAIYNGVIDFLLDKNNSASFKFKTKKSGQNRQRWHKRYYNNCTSE